MKKTTLIFLFVFYISTCFSQERFFNLYPGWITNVAIEYEDGYSLFAADTLDYPYSITPIFIKTDLHGDFIESFRYVSDSLAGFSIYTSDSYSIHNNYVLASGVYIEYLKNYILNPIVMYFNTDNYYCDSIKDFKSYFNGRSTQFKFHREVNGKIHLFGTSMYSSNWNTRTFFAVYDTLTGSFTVKDYPKPTSCVMTPYQALPTPDGGYIIACEQNMAYNLPEKIYACLLKTDSEGNEQWRYVIPGKTGQSPYPDFEPATFRPRVFINPEGGYYVVWTDPKIITYNYLVENPNSTIRIAKLTDNVTSCEFSEEKDLKTELDNPVLNYYLINDSYQDTEGNMFLLLQNYGGYNSSLVKIHSNGVGAWLRTYKCYPDDNAADNSVTELYGITRTTDGGFMLTGKFYSPASDLFPGGMIASCAFKTDSCGCFDAEGCNGHCLDSYSESYVYMAKAGVFPNPASDKITVNFEYSDADTEFNYKIYSLNGQVLQEGTSGASVPLQNGNIKIDISDLPSGYYTIQLWGGGKIFTGKFVKE